MKKFKYISESAAILSSKYLPTYMHNFSECFSCVGCEKDLSHDQFIMDDDKQIFCSDCYAKKKAFRCTTCKRPIVPGEGQKTAPRLRALGKDYHPDCFKCQVKFSK